MRRFVVVAVALAFTLALAPIVLADSCACSAPDHSCNTSISCTGGCYALCGSGGQCSSGCEAGGGDPGSNGPRHDHRVLPGSRVSLSETNLTAADIASLLTDALGSTVQFAPVDPDQTYSIDVINFPREDLAQVLAKFGAVAVGGRAEDIARAGDVGDAEVTIRLEGTTLGQVVGLVEKLVKDSGVRIHVTDPERPFNLDIQRMPLNDLLTALVGMGAIDLEYDTQ